MFILFYCQKICLKRTQLLIDSIIDILHSTKLCKWGLIFHGREFSDFIDLLIAIVYKIYIIYQYWRCYANVTTSIEFKGKSNFFNTAGNCLHNLISNKHQICLITRNVSEIYWYTCTQYCYMYANSKGCTHITSGIVLKRKKC